MFARTIALSLSLILAAAILSPAALLLSAEQVPDSGGIRGRYQADPTGQPTEDERRRREGSVFSGEGVIQYAGERLTFVSDNGTERLTILENLALDRVARTSRDSTSKTHWSVEGTITEYQGTNYLWLERAVTIRRSDDFGL